MGPQKSDTPVTLSKRPYPPRVRLHGNKKIVDIALNNTPFAQDCIIALVMGYAMTT